MIVGGDGEAENGSEGAYVMSIVQMLVLDLMVVNGDSICSMRIELVTSGIPIWLQFASILITMVHSSILQDPWAVNSGFGHNSRVSCNLGARDRLKR